MCNDVVKYHKVTKTDRKDHYLLKLNPQKLRYPDLKLKEPNTALYEYNN